MSQEEQDAVIGKAVREAAQLRREVKAIEISLASHAEAMASWSEHVKAHVNLGYTPRNAASRDDGLPSREEVINLLDDLKDKRAKLNSHETRLREAGVEH